MMCAVLGGHGSGLTSGSGRPVGRIRVSPISATSSFRMRHFFSEKGKGGMALPRTEEPPENRNYFCCASQSANLVAAMCASGPGSSVSSCSSAPQ